MKALFAEFYARESHANTERKHISISIDKIHKIIKSSYYFVQFNRLNSIVYALTYKFFYAQCFTLIFTLILQRYTGDIEIVIIQNFIVI